MITPVPDSRNHCFALAPSKSGGMKGIGQARTLRRAIRRALTVAALALAGLLVFGLLPGGRDAVAVAPSQFPLPPAPTVRYLHPHGPNRPIRHGCLVIHPVGGVSSALAC